MELAGIGCNHQSNICLCNLPTLISPALHSQRCISKWIQGKQIAKLLCHPSEVTPKLLP